MKTDNSRRNLQRFGVSAIAAGAIFFTGAQTTGAEEDKDFGEKLLYNGKDHGHVSELKELLEEENFLEKPDEADEWTNEYNSATEKAVTEFQEKYDLLVDGLAGIQTAGALVGLEKGDENDLVLALQEDLAELDYYESKLDGKFGPLTEEALVQFQEDEEVDDKEGIAGPYTYAALHEMTSRYNPDIKAPEDEAASDDTTEESAEASEPESDSSGEESSSESDGSAEESEQSSEENVSSSNEAETTLTMEATAYTANCEGCTGITYTGLDLNNNPDKKVVAVDPDVIPLGSTVEVEGYGEAVAGDIGGAIQGERIDLHVPTEEEAIEFGRQDVEVTIIDTP